MSPSWIAICHYPNEAEAAIAVAAITAAGLDVRMAPQPSQWTPSLAPIDVLVLEPDAVQARKLLGVRHQSRPVTPGRVDPQRLRAARARWREARALRWSGPFVLIPAVLLVAVWPRLAALLAVGGVVSLLGLVAGIGHLAFVRCPSCGDHMFHPLGRRGWSDASCQHCGFDLELWCH